MEQQGVRRSDRIDVAVNIELEGFDADGQSFWEKTRTLKVSRHGAAIRTARKLAASEELTLRNLDTGARMDVRVVGKIGEQDGEFVYGLTFLAPDPDAWGIEFPPLAEAENSASRILLECSGCRSREVLHLDEIETDVFHAARSLHRFCKKCRDSRIFRDVLEAPASGEPRTLAFERPRATSLPPPPRVKERRSHSRMPVRMAICIRRAGRPDEAAETENVSRGGLCFESASRFERGDRIEVATHYRPGTPAIFIPAKIVHLQELKEKRMFRYGITYLNAMEAHLTR